MLRPSISFILHNPSVFCWDLHFNFTLYMNEPVTIFNYKIMWETGMLVQFGLAWHGGQLLNSSQYSRNMMHQIVNEKEISYLVFVLFSIFGDSSQLLWNFFPFFFGGFPYHSIPTYTMFYKLWKTFRMKAMGVEQKLQRADYTQTNFV